MQVTIMTELEVLTPPLDADGRKIRTHDFVILPNGDKGIVGYIVYNDRATKRMPVRGWYVIVIDPYMNFPDAWATYCADRVRVFLSVKKEDK